MGLFDFLKAKTHAESPVVTFPAELGAVANGMFVPQEELPDELFSTGVLGPCCGVDPADGRIYAPIGGKITQLAETIHAIGIEAGGIEILIHVVKQSVCSSEPSLCFFNRYAPLSMLPNTSAIYRQYIV